jgi:hypothetical protein
VWGGGGGSVEFRGCKQHAALIRGGVGVVDLRGGRGGFEWASTMAMVGLLQGASFFLGALGVFAVKSLFERR